MGEWVLCGGWVMVIFDRMRFQMLRLLVLAGCAKLAAGADETPDAAPGVDDRRPPLPPPATAYPERVVVPDVGDIMALVSNEEVWRSVRVAVVASRPAWLAHRRRTAARSMWARISKRTYGARGRSWWTPCR